MWLYLCIYTVVSTPEIKHKKIDRTACECAAKERKMRLKKKREVKQLFEEI